MKRSSRLAGFAAIGMMLVLGFAVLRVANAQQDLTPPSAPTGISVYIMPTGQVYISWGASADDSAVAGYYLYRNGGFLITSKDTSYTDNAPAGIYTYSVAAYDAAGNVSAIIPAGNSVTVLPDPTAPSQPANFVAAMSSSSAVLSWDPSTDNVYVVGYYVYRNGVKLSTDQPISDTTYTDTNLTPGTSYAYSVAAYDAVGNISMHSAQVIGKAIFDVTAPSAPTSFYVAPLSSTELYLAWHLSTDNIQVAGYYIYRDGVQIDNVSSSPYMDQGLTPGTNHTYTVVAYDEVGNPSIPSIPASGTTKPGDNVPPSIPTGLSLTPLSSSAVKLTWNPSTDNDSVAGYTISRDNTVIGGTTSTSYVDTGLATSTTYNYEVTASDPTGNVSPQTSGPVMTLSYDPGTPALAPEPVPADVPPPPPAPTPAGGTGVSTGNHFIFTTSLFLGSRNNDVKNLQATLIAQGELAQGYVTGYFGGLTQKAVQKFQCDQGVVCSGSPASTGWGFVVGKPGRP